MKSSMYRFRIWEMVMERYSGEGQMSRFHQDLKGSLEKAGLPYSMATVNRIIYLRMHHRRAVNYDLLRVIALELNTTITKLDRLK